MGAESSQPHQGGGGGLLNLTEAAMAARVRFSRAADAMGPELSGVAIDVCCFEKGLETVERERQWPARSAKLLLRAALLALPAIMRRQPFGPVATITIGAMRIIALRCQQG